MISCAKEEQTRFVGISNKAACLYALNRLTEAIILDEYVLEHEKGMPQARKTKLETRSKKALLSDTTSIFDSMESHDLHMEPDYPKFEVKISKDADKGIYATSPIDVGQAVFGAPVAPYAASLHSRFDGIRCDTCFLPLDTAATIPCKTCCVGFCSEKCVAPHAPFCNIEWLSHVPPLSRLGLKTYITSLSDPKNTKETLNTQTLIGKTTNGPTDSRELAEIYVPDISIIRGLLTNENKVDLGSVLLPSCLDAVLLANLYSQKSGIKVDTRELLTYILVANSNAFEVVQYLEDMASGDEDETKEEFSSTSIGFAQYALPSLLNHSCDPNTINSYQNSSNHLSMRATKLIEKGAQVFHCYGPSFYVNDLEERQKLLKTKYCFDCHCYACEIEKIKPQNRNIFHSEGELDEALSDFMFKNLNDPVHSMLAHSIKSLLSDLKKCSMEIGKVSAEVISDYRRLLPPMSRWIGITEKRYELLFAATKGEGFSIKREGLPIMPDSRKLQLEYASQLDSVASMAASMQKFEEAHEYMKKALLVLECWYPAHSVELGREYEKALSIVFPHLIMTNIEWLETANSVAEKAYRSFFIAFGPEDANTKRVYKTYTTVYNLLDVQKRTKRDRNRAE